MSNSELFFSEINQGVFLIRGVAKQINLVTLNAAIEAARVEEYEYGTVVANEVRQLFERTQTAEEVNGH